MDLEPLPALEFINVNRSHLYFAHGGDDDIPVDYCHRRCRVLVRNPCNRTPSVPFGVHYPNVSRCHLVDQRSVYSPFYLRVNLFGVLCTLVSVYYQVFLCHARSGSRGRAWANRCPLTVGLGCDCLPPSSECGRCLWFVFVLLFRLQFELQFALRLLLQLLVILWASFLHCICMLRGL